MKYPQTSAPAEPPFMVESRQPAAPSRFETHVIVPLAQSGVSALVVTMALVVVGWRQDWAWDVPVLGGLLTFTGFWVWRLWFGDRLLWGVETIIKHDVTGDGKVGRPHDVTLYNMGDYTAPPRVDADLDGTPTKRALIAFVLTCYNTGKTSERAHGVMPWQRARYKDFRDSLLRLQVAEWNNPANHKRGWRLIVTPDVALSVIDAHIL